MHYAKMFSGKYLLQPSIFISRGATECRLATFRDTMKVNAEREKSFIFYFPAVI